MNTNCFSIDAHLTLRVSPSRRLVWSELMGGLLTCLLFFFTSTTLAPPPAQCKTMIVGDERCQYVGRSQYDVRNYYSADQSNLWLPLGPRWDTWVAFQRLRARLGFVLTPSSQREYAFNSIFSQDTNAGRAELARVIGEGGERSDLPIFVAMAKNWNRDVNHRWTEQLNSRAYVDALSGSVFTLSPAGHNPECYRLFEAVEAGSIPVVVEGDPAAARGGRCKDSLHHWRDAPVVRLDSWDDLFPTVERLMQDGEALDRRQMDLLVWYEERMREVVTDFEDFMQASYAEEWEEDGRDQGLSILTSRKISEKDPCEDIVLFAPDANLGLGRQLNHYLLAVMMATFMNKPMVISDAPQDVICRSDLDYPLGFSSVVKHPDWLGRGCAVPCQSTRTYSDWDALRRTQDVNSPVTVCPNDGGEGTNVIVLGGNETLGILETHFREVMTHLSLPVAYDWAVRVGANPQEADAFSKLEGDAMWDYLSTILVRSGVLQFQPSILKDSVRRIKTRTSVRQPYRDSFDAMLVRRGEDVLADPEAKSFIDNYWDSRGYYNRVTQTAKYNFIPLHQYLRHYFGMKCSSEVRKVYVATDDPVGVEMEIAGLGPAIDEATRFLGCHKIQFTVSPLQSDLETSNDCAARHANTVGHVADFIMMNKADTFVGDFLSDWGQLVRMVRLELKPELGTISDEPVNSRPLSRLMRTQTLEIERRNPVSLRDTEVAWGYSHPPAPL